MIAFVLPAIVAFVGETFLVLTCLVFSDKLYNNKAMYMINDSTNSKPTDKDHRETQHLQEKSPLFIFDMMFRAEKNYYYLIVVIHALLPVDFTRDVFA